MKRSIQLVSLLVCIVFVAAPAGCDMFNRDEPQAGDDRRGAPAGQGTGKVAVAQLKPSQAATTQPAMNKVSGTITFNEMSNNRIHVTGEVRGLTPNTEHGFHVHEKGDLSAPDFASAGGHFNPEGKSHGGLHGAQRHVGDLGNIKSNAQGVAKVDVTMENATLQGHNAIVDRSVLVHAKPDDLKTDPAGDSGARIAGGVIQMKR